MAVVHIESTTALAAAHTPVTSASFAPLTHNKHDLTYHYQILSPLQQILQYILQDQATLDLLATGQRFGDLFRISSPSFALTASHPTGSSHVLSCNKRHVPPLALVHEHSGHTAISKLQHLFSFPKHVLLDFHCKACALSKRHRLPFSRSSSRISRIF
ncbi:hypothetical protein RND81_05G066700 [Saponaria officinalis]|uniref:GAG-pre-integrase domain-containing protein n=1 Tax=Saponaria officinalis TaxID=3572 RepID=A0AAW1KR62_SAPOF